MSSTAQVGEFKEHTNKEQFYGPINRPTMADQINNNAIYPPGAA